MIIRDRTWDEPYLTVLPNQSTVRPVALDPMRSGTQRELLHVSVTPLAEMNDVALADGMAWPVPPSQ